MPLLIPVIIGASALLAIVGAAYGRDQKDKREKEQKRARAEISKLEDRISGFERKYNRLLHELGKKYHQVRAMADEIARLRGKLADARHLRR